MKTMRYFLVMVSLFGTAAFSNAAGLVEDSQQLEVAPQVGQEVVSGFLDSWFAALDYTDPSSRAGVQVSAEMLDLENFEMADNRRKISMLKVFPAPIKTPEQYLKWYENLGRMLSQHKVIYKYLDFKQAGNIIEATWIETFFVSPRFLNTFKVSQTFRVSARLKVTGDGLLKIQKYIIDPLQED